MKAGLPKVVDSDTIVLILGSFPSEQSLEKREYYANRTNDFWKLMSAVVGENLILLDYKARIKILLNHGIGLWDVIGKCEREGSADGNIRNPQLNDFSVLKKTCPRLRLICFNGGKAAAWESDLQQFGCATKQLPSSSGANRRDAEVRLHLWQSILDR